MLDSSAEAAGTSPGPEPGRGRIVSATATPRDDGVSALRIVLLSLRRRKWILFGFIVAVPLLSWIALRQVTPLYTATGSLLYAPKEFKSPQLQSALQADPVTEAVMASQAEILQSLHIAQKVAERGNLYDNPEFNRALRPPSFWHSVWRMFRDDGTDDDATAGATGPELNASRNATLVNVQAALRAKPVRFSHVIEVSFVARDPIVAAAAVNNAMDVYVKDQYAAKFRAIRRMTELLTRRAEELRAEVRKAEDGIAAYRAEQHLSQGMHATMDAEQISHLAEDLTRARADLANAEGRLDAARGRAGAAAQAAIAPSVVQFRVRQDQLASQMQAQAARLGRNHPEAEGLRRQLAETERGIAAEVGRVVAAIESERRVAAERVTALERDLRDAQREAARAAQAQVPLNAMLRDAEVARAQLHNVLQGLQQNAQQAAVETSEAHEISQALPPAHPSWPAAGRLLLGSVALGCFLGLVVVYALHLTDSTLNSGEDVRTFTQLPCFALLPEPGRRALGHLSIEDYVARRPLTAFAEQVRALRAGLWLGADRPRVIATTAARPAEGKTVVTIALGRSASLSGERVLAIECDMRQPHFARRLHAQGGVGLSQLLKGEASLADAIQHDLLTGMHFIHAGQPTTDVLGMFMSESMARLLATVRAEYDLVLLDAPPVQAMTEARLVAANADATILCVRWRSTPRGVLRHAMDLLEDAHANVVGVVLTRVDPRAHVRSGFADAEVYHRR
ncbi:MAG: GumC family protein, partial [Acetobacteraceae bacterium]